MTYDELDKLAEKVTEASYYEGSECGEYWRNLAALSTNDWRMSDEFKAAYELELSAEAKTIDEDYTIVVEVVQRPTTIRYLRRKSDHS